MRQKVYRAGSKNRIGVGIFIFCSIFISGLLYSISAPNIHMPTDEASSSIRMRCIGENLTGIVSDNLTDMLWNPAKLLDKSSVGFEFPNKLFWTMPGPFKLRLGVWLEGSISNNNYSYEDTLSSSYDKYYYHHENKYSNSSYNLRFLASKKLSDKSTIGIRYRYISYPYRQTIKYVCHYLDSTNENYDYYSNSSWENNPSDRKDCFFSNSILVGLLRKTGENSSMELLGDFQWTNSKQQHIYECERYDTLIEEYQTGVTNGYVHLYSGNQTERDNESMPSYNIGIGFKCSKKLSDKLNLHILSMNYAGSGDANSFEYDSTYNFNRNYDYYDDSISFDDTIISYNFSHDSLYGKSRVFTGFFKGGGEININSEVTAGFGVCLSYSYTDFPFTASSEDMYGNILVTEGLHQEKAIDIIIPFGIEYYIGKGISFRLGMEAEEFYAATVEGNNESRRETSTFSGPSFTKTAGFGWRLFNRLNLDVAAEPLTKIESWKIQVSYSLY